MHKVIKNFPTSIFSISIRIYPLKSFQLLVFSNCFFQLRVTLKNLIHFGPMSLAVPIQFNLCSGDGPEVSNQSESLIRPQNHWGTPNSNNRSFNFVFERPHFRLEIGCFDWGSFRHFFCLCNQFCNFIIYLNRSNIKKTSLLWQILENISRNFVKISVFRGKSWTDFWKTPPSIFCEYLFSFCKISGYQLHRRKKEKSVCVKSKSYKIDDWMSFPEIVLAHNPNSNKTEQVPINFGWMIFPYPSSPGGNFPKICQGRI